MKNTTFTKQRRKLAAAGLTAKQALCLALHCFDGLTQEDIALSLGVTHQAVCCHIAAARVRLARAGLCLRKPESEPEVTVYPVDPAELDKLGPDELKVLW